MNTMRKIRRTVEAMLAAFDLRVLSDEQLLRLNLDDVLEEKDGIPDARTRRGRLEFPIHETRPDLERALEEEASYEGWLLAQRLMREHALEAFMQAHRKHYLKTHGK